MAFVGFEFNKIQVEKKSKTGKITINNNVNLVNVTKADLKIGKNEENAIRFEFEYNSDYGDAGKIMLNGSVLYLTTSDEVKVIIDEWKKDKKVKKELMTALLNRILNKCNIQTIILSDTVGLPPPVPLPHVKKE